jgi:hypothetical protein
MSMILARDREAAVTTEFLNERVTTYDGIRLQETPG